MQKNFSQILTSDSHSIFKSIQTQPLFPLLAEACTTENLPIPGWVEGATALHLSQYWHGKQYGYGAEHNKTLVELTVELISWKHLTSYQAITESIFV